MFGGNHGIDDVLLDLGAQRSVCRSRRCAASKSPRRRSRFGLPSTYSTLTWLLPSGRRKSSVPARRTSRKLAAQLVRQHDRQRHQLRGLVAGVAEHQALVAGAARVHAHGDIGRLRLDRVQHAAGLAVEAEGRVGVADCLMVSRAILGTST